MTALDRRLAKTFRAVRWTQSRGQPICALCFDGVDLETPRPDPLVPGLSRYRCRLCRRNFSDAAGTIFKLHQPASLAVLAHLVLAGDPRTVPGLSPREINRYWAVMAKIRHSNLAAVWRTGLTRARITVAAIERQLAPARRTA